MKTLWCWRCQKHIPMMEEEEYTVAFSLYQQAFKLSGKSITERFEPLVDYYEKLSGFRDTNPNSIIHHRIALYGPPCEKCGKPYRTKEASFCASCGNKR